MEGKGIRILISLLWGNIDLTCCFQGSCCSCTLWLYFALAGEDGTPHLFLLTYKAHWNQNTKEWTSGSSDKTWHLILKNQYERNKKALPISSLKFGLHLASNNGYLIIVAERIWKLNLTKKSKDTHSRTSTSLERLILLSSHPKHWLPSLKLLYGTVYSAIRVWAIVFSFQTGSMKATGGRQRASSAIWSLFRELFQKVHLTTSVSISLIRTLLHSYPKVG